MVHGTKIDIIPSHRLMEFVRRTPLPAYGSIAAATKNQKP
jgi:hypothetical protein